MKKIIVHALFLLLSACAASGHRPAFEHYDLIVRAGLVYDGNGGDPVRADIGIRGDRIAAIADLSRARATRVIDAGDRAVAPGFINVLSWATVSLLQDGRSLSDIKQGVTLEIFGEGWSMGPLNEAMKREAVELQGDFKYPVAWTTLGEYLDHLVDRGVSANVASFVGATTLRIHELGHENRAPNAQELERMQGLVEQAMREGALGVGSSMIYAPATFAKTDELIALAQVAARHGGAYISHLRSETDRFIEALDELIAIARATGAHAEVYHLKAGGRTNWPKMRQAIDRIDAARADGLSVSANMYPYTAGATGLNAAMPPWVQEGGRNAWIARLKDPAIRARVAGEMRERSDDWESLYWHAGPDNTLLIGFDNPALRPLIGKTLAQAAEQRGTTPEETAIDLVIEDNSRVEIAYFLMSEENVALGIAQPWVSFGSDAESLAPEGAFLNHSPHPRAYGTFARVLGKYVREDGVLSLSDAIRRLTSLPADNFKLRERGRLVPGYYADIVVFDPATVRDRATFERPHQFAEGVTHVVVNGVPVLIDGEHIGTMPGRVVRGPGYVAP